MKRVRFKLQGIEQFLEGEADNQGMVDIRGMAYRADTLPFDVPIKGTLYGILLNYRGAYDALKASMNEDPYQNSPKAPILYIKPKNTFIGHRQTIPLPERIEALEMGAALGVVIGKTATKVTEAEALDYVSGYTVVNDVSIPHECVYRPAVKEKTRDGFCPIGPWIALRDSIPDPNGLSLRVSINGVVKQENNTQNLIRSTERLISDVTEFMTLYKGDVLLVGVPENPPQARENDLVKIEIEGVGVLENRVVKETDVLGGSAV